MNAFQNRDFPAKDSWFCKKQYGVEGCTWHGDITFRLVIDCSCIYVYVYIYIYTYIHIHIFFFTHTHTHTYAHTYAYTYTTTYTFTNTDTYTFTNAYTYTYTCIHIYIYKYIYYVNFIYIFMLMCVCVCVCSRCMSCKCIQCVYVSLPPCGRGTQDHIYVCIYNYTSGFWKLFVFSKCWECHHPNWRTHMYAPSSRPVVPSGPWWRRTPGLMDVRENLQGTMDLLITSWNPWNM